MYAGQVPFGCGQCLPCRINRRRLWTERLSLEMTCHEHSSFATLTYSDEFLPSGETLEPSHATKFLKVLRGRYGARIRYYMCGEYGDVSFRPHYHFILFGYRGSHVEGTRYGGQPGKGPICCQVCRDFHACWKFGRVDLRMIAGTEPLSYVTGYVTKKMTKASDPRLGGRYPEFCRMSTHPGIGALSVEAIADAYAKYTFTADDAPGRTSRGKKSAPLGRYIVGKLREALKFHPEYTEDLKALTLGRLKQNMRDMRLDAVNPDAPAAQIVTDRFAGKRAALEARTKIFSQKRSL